MERELANAADLCSGEHRPLACPRLAAGQTHLRAAQPAPRRAAGHTLSRATGLLRSVFGESPKTTGEPPVLPGTSLALNQAEAAVCDWRLPDLGLTFA